MTIRFTVYGLPQPKGSAKAFIPKGWNRAIVTTATKGLKDWEHKIASAAQAHAGTLMVGPVTLSVAFYLPRPKSIKNKPVQHTKRPDLDKLIRGATDALTNVLFHDDSQIVSILASKHYAATVEQAPRAEFIIEEWPSQDYPNPFGEHIAASGKPIDGYSQQQE